jgi:hypothetical protein
MGSYDPFRHLKHKLWPKERSGVKFDSRPLKVENWPDFLVCKWHATHRWKDLNEGDKFSLDLISIRGLHAKLWGPKVARVSTLGILRFPFGSHEKKCHLDVPLTERHKIYYKGECGGFLQVHAMVSLVNPRLPVVHFSTKSAPTIH